MVNSIKLQSSSSSLGFQASRLPTFEKREFTSFNSIWFGSVQWESWFYACRSSDNSHWISKQETLERMKNFQAAFYLISNLLPDKPACCISTSWGFSEGGIQEKISSSSCSVQFSLALRGGGKRIYLLSLLKKQTIFYYVGYSIVSWYWATWSPINPLRRA